MSRRPRIVVAFALSVAAVAFASDAAADPCDSKSTLVGEKCSTFGDGWAVERQSPITFRFGFRYGEFTPTGVGFHESFRSKYRPKNYTGYRFAGDALGVSKLSAAGFDGGLSYFVVGQLYVGLEGGVLYGAANTARIQPNQPASDLASVGRLTLLDDSGVDVTLLHGGAPIGYRIPLGRASLRGEVLFGVIQATVSHRGQKEDFSSIDRKSFGLRGIIEPRVAADIWFTQHVSFGAYAGVNMVDRNAHAFGVALTVHLRSFDGDLSLF